MKSRLFFPVGAFCLTLIAMPCGCGGAVDPDGERSEHLEDALEDGDAIAVELEQLGNPKWKPVDFHQFTSKWFKYQTVMSSLLPAPNHAWSPLLGVAPGAPHAGPYDHELADGMAAAGYVDTSSFTAADFTQGVYLTWMNVPRKESAPFGSSPDFSNGSIIPNTIFPINVEIKYSRNGVVESSTSVFDVPAMETTLGSAMAVDGHSHFPMWTNDSSGSYPKEPGPASYRWMITMIDAEGEGWSIEVPYNVN